MMSRKFRPTAPSFLAIQQVTQQLDFPPVLKSARLNHVIHHPLKFDHATKSIADPTSRRVGRTPQFE
jgi:hypothetical protein